MTEFLAFIVLIAVALAWALSFVREEVYLRVFEVESMEILMRRFASSGWIVAMIVVTLLAELAAVVLALVVLL